MESASQALTNLIVEFQNLPGIGHKTAERLAYFVLRSPSAEVLKLAAAIHQVKENIRNCKDCFNITERDLCPICEDSSRDRSLLCVVEQPKDVYAVEQSGSYKGLYHVLQGSFAPLEGVSPQDLTVRSLLARAKGGEVREVILATNPDFEGEGTALYLHEQLKGLSNTVQITRIARGMPSGSQLEHVSRNIVSDAFEGRRAMEGSSKTVD